MLLIYTWIFFPIFKNFTQMSLPVILKPMLQSLHRDKNKNQESSHGHQPPPLFHSQWGKRATWQGGKSSPLSSAHKWWRKKEKLRPGSSCSWALLLRVDSSFRHTLFMTAITTQWSCMYSLVELVGLLLLHLPSSKVPRACWYFLKHSSTINTYSVFHVFFSCLNYIQGPLLLFLIQ